MGAYRDAMDQAMVLKGLSPRTREAYLSWVNRLVQFARVTADQLTPEHVRAFLLDLTQARHVAFSTFNQAAWAIRLFFREVLKREPELGEAHYYQRPQHTLPQVLSGEEVLRILEATTSLRERALFETAYSAGLRLGEVMQLKVSDIDSQRMTIRVEQGKGRKDRYVMLSQTLLETLRAYWREARPRVFLFPGHRGKRPLHECVAQRAFKEAREKAGIRKRVSFHSLRHAFATHLLESGTNVRTIQALLGHRSLGTTQRYTHLAQNYLHEARSPLDRLCQKEAPRA